MFGLCLYSELYEVARDHDLINLIMLTPNKMHDPVAHQRNRENFTVQMERIAKK